LRNQITGSSQIAPLFDVIDPSLGFNPDVNNIFSQSTSNIKPVNCRFYLVNGTKQNSSGSTFSGNCHCLILLDKYSAFCFLPFNFCLYGRKNDVLI